MGVGRQPDAARPSSAPHRSGAGSRRGPGAQSRTEVLSVAHRAKL